MGGHPVGAAPTRTPPRDSSFRASCSYGGSPHRAYGPLRVQGLWARWVCRALRGEAGRNRMRAWAESEKSYLFGAAPRRIEVFGCARRPTGRCVCRVFGAVGCAGFLGAKPAVTKSHSWAESKKSYLFGAAPRRIEVFGRGCGPGGTAQGPPWPPNRCPRLVCF